MYGYFLLGIIGVVLLHLTLRWASRAKPKKLKRALTWGLIGLVLLVALLLLRFGMPQLAAIVGGIGALVPLLHRLLQVVWLYRSLKRGPGRGYNPGHGEVPRDRPPMTPKEARKILGVGEEADKQEIHRAYKELMRKLHPDQGGNAYLAQQLNEARDVLLKRNK